MRISVKTIKKIINELQPGDRFYLNAVNITPKAIDAFKQFIAEGTITPDREELENMVVEESVCKFMDGTCIFPQMTYIKL